MRSVCLFLVAAVAPVAVCAQSYAAKDVRFEGSAYGKDALLSAAGLKASGPFTKAQVDAAVQKLADTGLFADVHYSVDEKALVVTLVSIAADKMLPLQFTNLVWWKPGEVDSILRTRVPLYTGRVPINGNLLESVEKAVVQLMAEKGIAAKVEQMTSEGESGGAIGALTLGLTTPEVKVGAIRLAGAEATAAELEKVQAILGGQEYDELSTRSALVKTTEGIYKDDGYLDATVEPGAPGEPKAAGFARYDVDLNGTLRGDGLYRVASVTVTAAPTLSQAEVQKGLQINKGDVASANLLRVGQSRLKFTYEEAGYLDARVDVDVQKDQTAHTAAYRITVVPGEVYHVASVNTSGFSPEQQKEFERSFHVDPGAVAGREVVRAVMELNRKKEFQGTKIRLNERRDRQQHTVALTLVVGQGR